MADVKFRDSDQGWAALKKTLSSLRSGDSYVKVGLVGDTAGAEHEGLTNVELAAIHEFGTEKIPERSFIRRAFDENRGKYMAALQPLVKRIYSGQITAKDALDLMGTKIKWDMKNLILEGEITPPDAPATIKRKEAKGHSGSGSPKTLIDSGRLVAAIDHAVVIDGADVGGETKEAGSANVTVTED